MNLQYGLAETEEDLLQILDLQQLNLAQHINTKTAKSQGFVTVQHDLFVLKAMNAKHPHIVARNDKKVVAYALAMSPSFQERIPILRSMFERIHQLRWNDNLLTSDDYIVMGQICVAKDWRGKGVFQQLYETMQLHLATQFPLVITEIATRNTRSMRAHQKVGFKTLDVYQSNEEEWAIVVWDWQNA